ncbi:MAG: insulinase family protein, partial [Ignavibacteria bacterium]|nr:insulinase family protein [Ignavibacteria bacterium]
MNHSKAKNNRSMGAWMHACMQSCKHAAMLALLFGSIGFAQFKLPKYEVVTLDNGLTIYLMEKKDVPLISFSAVFDAGAIRDGAQNGLASFTAEALKFGTKNYTKIQIDSIFNFYGSSLNTYARLDYSVIHSEFMKDDLDKLLPVIKDVITNPTFPEEEIIKRKQRWVAELDQAKESPRQVIGSYFNRFVFTNSIYANPVSGTKFGIESIKSEDIKPFYKKNYPLKYSAIAIVGDFDTEQMKNKIVSHLIPGSFLINKNDSIRTKDKIEYYDIDRLPVYTLHDDSVLIVPGSKDTRFKKGDSNVYLINKDNATETTFMIGAFGVPMSNADQIQIDVINTIL